MPARYALRQPPEDRGQALKVTASRRAGPRSVRSMSAWKLPEPCISKRSERWAWRSIAHIALAVVIGALGHLGRQLRYLLLQLGDVTEDLLALLQHGALVAELHHLRQVADLQPFGEGDRPLCREDACQGLRRRWTYPPVLAARGRCAPRAEMTKERSSKRA